MSDREARRAAAEVERIGGVDDHFVIEVLLAGHCERFFRGHAVRGQDDQIARASRLFERAAGDAISFAGDKVAQLLRRPRADHHLMSKRTKRLRECFADVARSKDPNLHDFHAAKSTLRASAPPREKLFISIE